MTNQAIIFENEGLIDIRAIKTFGVNVKETENPFGYFGTGLKYAIAIILRNHCKIMICCGPETYDFTLKTTEIRGKEFSIITMNGEELGFTSELGKNWELWQAYRELYCNTLDEFGTIELVGPFSWRRKEGKTIIIVEGEAFTSVHHKRHEFILQSTPLEITKDVEIHEGPASNIFYKGIAVGGLTKQSQFKYNVAGESIRLTEDRTLKSIFDAEWKIVQALVQSRDPRILRKVLILDPEYFEDELHFSYCHDKPGEVFLEVMAELIKDNSLRLNDSAVVLFRKFSTVEKPMQVQLTTVQEIQLSRAKTFCAKLNLYTDKFPIVVTENLGTNILGLAKDRTIYLALDVFEMGTKMVAITLIEEYIHLDKGHSDMTRGMQNLLFNKIISLGEEVAGEPL